MGRLFRRAIDVAFRGLREAQVALKGKKTLRNLVYYPLVENEGDLSDILNRANWYFPEKGFSEAQITIPVSGNLVKFANAPATLASPRAQENYIGKNRRIRIIECTHSGLKELARKSDAVLLWKAGALFSLPSWFAALDKAWIVDKGYFLVTEARNYIWLYNETVPEEKLWELLGLAKKNFLRFCGQASKFRKAYVFGTGPSVSKAIEFDFSDGFSIVTNTMINDGKLMRHIRPIAVIHGDFIYHMGPSVYASKFRRQLFSKYGNELFSLIRFDIMPFLLARYPGLEEKLVALPMRLFSGPHIPSAKEYYLNLSNNSLVGYMLPVSCAVADEVFVLGCDGRKKEDKLFWGHTKTVFYDDLQKTIMETHPSVFRDTDFDVYYNETINDAEAFILHAESKGKTIVCLTPSNIPALHGREKKRHS